MAHWSRSKKDVLAGLTLAERTSALNTRALNALNGDHEDPAKAIIDLLLSEVEISQPVRALLAEALSYDGDEFPRLTFAGKVGRKSPAGMIAQRRDWLDLADDFYESGLSQPDYLKSGRQGIHPDSRKLLQEAIAFHKAMQAWAMADPEELQEVFRYAEEQEKPFITRAVFCEFVVENGLTDAKRLREFLQGG